MALNVSQKLFPPTIKYSSKKKKKKEKKKSLHPAPTFATFLSYPTFF